MVDEMCVCCIRDILVGCFGICVEFGVVCVFFCSVYVGYIIG